MRLDHVDNMWWMKPTTDEEGNTIEEFFWCVDTEYYTREDYTLVTDEYKEAYEREHYPEEPIEDENLIDNEIDNEYNNYEEIEENNE